MAALFLFVFLSFFASGCMRGLSSHFREDPFPNETRVKLAVLPFTNLSSERDADKKITYATITHLLRSEYFDMIPLGETQKAMREAKVMKDEDLSIENIKKFGELTGADVLLMGVVEEYKIDSNTIMGEKVFVPEVSVSARLVFAADGSMIWSVNHHRRGDDRVTVFGMGRIDSISDLSDIIVKDITRALIKAVEQDEEILALLKRGRLPVKGEAPAEASAASAPAGSGAAGEIERLKQEKAELTNEIMALRRKLGEKVVPASPPSTSPVPVAVPPEAPAKTEPAAAKKSEQDPHAQVKAQYQALYQMVKKQY